MSGAARSQAALKALAEPRRVAILRLVRTRELPAGEISKHFKTTRPAISQHLGVLRKAGLLSERRDGTRRLYRIRPEGFDSLREFLGAFWDDALIRLKAAAEAGPGARRGSAHPGARRGSAVHPGARRGR